MSNFYIDPAWIELIRSSAFFYPAAGTDYTEPLEIFQDYIDTFWFGDLGYARGLDLPPVFPSGAGFRLVDKRRTGDLDGEIKQIEPIRADIQPSYRWLPPSYLTEIYERLDGRRVTVVRRRGFSQMALTKDFKPGSLGVFMHRGDSSGEAGSNVYFLANKAANFPPCARLFDKLGGCLRHRALIISDGSNTPIQALRKLHHSTIGGQDAFAAKQGRDFEFGGFRWTCVGWLSRRYGPTLVWGVTRCDERDTALCTAEKERDKVYRA